MKRTTILLAGAMLSLTVIAGANDPFAEERYRMKNGRYTPAEEARLKSRREAAPKSTAACCRSAFASAIADPASNEARFRIKNGRNTPAVEARERALSAAAAIHIQKCIEMAKCASMNSEKQTAKSAAAETNPHMKQGRLVLMEEERSETNAVASTQGPACEHECCRHAD
jgi:hypothetical protein